MAGPTFTPPRPGSGDHGYDEVTFVWPDNARTIAMWLLVLGVWAVWGWVSLRGNACWICGRDKGLCRHTRDTHDSGGMKR